MENLMLHVRLWNFLLILSMMILIDLCLCRQRKYHRNDVIHCFLLKNFILVMLVRLAVKPKISLKK